MTSHSAYSIFCSIEDIISSFCEIKPQFLWHHTHSIWHCINTISFTTSTVLMISHQLNLRELILYICRSHIHCIVYSNLFTMFVPSEALYLCLTPHFPWYHTLCVYDIVPILCLTLDTLYKVSHPQFMTSHHIIFDITGTAFMSSVPWYLTLLPQYLSPHNHSKYDLWTIVYMTSHPLYI